MTRIALVVSPAIGTEQHQNVATARTRAIRLSLQHGVGYAKVVSASGHEFGFVQGREAELVKGEWHAKENAPQLMDPNDV